MGPFTSYTVASIRLVVMFPILCCQVRPRYADEGYRSLAKFEVKIFYPATVTAHVQREKVVAVNMLPAVISFSSPELRVWLALKQVARLHERLADAKLIATNPD